MLCKDCEHFHILCETWKDVDSGRAECKKYNLVTDFLNHRKFRWLSCIDEERKENENG